MKPPLPDIQLFLRPGIVEFGWGHPDFALLPVDGMLQATGAALKQDGSLALAYGTEQGSLERSPLCQILLYQVAHYLGIGVRGKAVPGF